MPARRQEREALHRIQPATAAAIALNRFGLGARPTSRCRGRPEALAAARSSELSAVAAGVGAAAVERGARRQLRRAAARRAPSRCHDRGRGASGARDRDPRPLPRCRRRAGDERAGHAGAVRRAPGPLLGQSLRGVDREADARIDRRLRSRPKRSARTSSAVSKTCCSPSSATRRCCSTSIRCARSARRAPAPGAPRAIDPERRRAA